MRSLAIETLPYGDLRPAHAVSAMLIHGTGDTISPIGGDYSRHRGPKGNCAAGFAEPLLASADSRRL